jgi:hypothetical protein
MKKALIKKILPILSFLLLAPWPIAYAYADNGGGNTADFVQVTPAPTEAEPSINAYGGTITSVTPGDLFYLSAPGTNIDIVATLYVTNSGELIHHYKYIILRIGVYARDSEGQWQKAMTQSGLEVPEMYISMIDSQAVFHLPGNANYKITIDSGSIYSLETNSGQAGLAQPQFYLDVNQG